MPSVFGSYSAVVDCMGRKIAISMCKSQCRTPVVAMLLQNPSCTRGNTALPSPWHEHEESAYTSSVHTAQLPSKLDNLLSALSPWF